MADYDYDEGEVTPREQLAAQRQKGISQQNAHNVRTQLQRQLANYDTADQQNRKLADLQLQQNSRKTSADRFEAQRDLQNSTLGLLGSMGTAMNGSSTGNLMRMLESRNDKENNTYWAQHQQNQDSVENSYQDSLNQNRIARLDAMQSAEKAINDIATDMAASLNNINPNLSEPPATPEGWLESIWDPAKVAEMQENDKLISGYMRPDREGARSTVQRHRNVLQGGDYFSQLMNRFNAPETHRTPERLQNFAGLGIEEEQRMRDALASLDKVPAMPSQIPVQTPYKTGNVVSGLMPPESQIPKQTPGAPSSASQASQASQASTASSTTLGKNGNYYTNKYVPSSNESNYYQVQRLKGL